MDNSIATNSTGSVPLSPILKTALATVNKSTTTNNGETGAMNDGNGKCFPEDRVSKDYYFDSYAHLYVYEKKFPRKYFIFLLKWYSRRNA